MEPSIIISGLLFCIILILQILLKHNECKQLRHQRQVVIQRVLKHNATIMELADELDEIQSKQDLEKTRLTLHNEALDKEIMRLNDVISAKHKALQGVLDSCVHPDTAVRAVMVDLKPIKQALEIK